MSVLLKEWLDLAMFAALCGFILLGFPVSFTLAGTALLFALIGMSVGVFDADFIGVWPNRIYGVMTNEVLIAVPLFVFMGVMLERSKVAEELLDTMGQLFGTLRGGLGISVCVVGALLAASSGIVGATVVTMGLISLPTMLRRGYDPKLACGTIAAAGTLGQIIPPSIVLVVLGDQISNAHQEAQRALGNFSPEPVSVGDLFAGALIPEEDLPIPPEDIDRILRHVQQRLGRRAGHRRELDLRRIPREPNERPPEIEPGFDHALSDLRQTLHEPHARCAVHAVEIQLARGEPGLRAFAHVHTPERLGVEGLVPVAGRFRGPRSSVEPLAHLVVRAEPARSDRLVRRPARVAAKLFLSRRLNQSPRHRKTTVCALHRGCRLCRDRPRVSDP